MTNSTEPKPEPICHAEFFDQNVYDWLEENMGDVYVDIPCEDEEDE